MAMVSTFSNISLHSLSLNQIRKQHVDAAIFAVKVLSIFFALVTSVYIIKEVLARRLELETWLTRLSNDVKDITTFSKDDDGPAKNINYQIIVDKSVFGPIGATLTAANNTTPKVVSKSPLNLVGVFISPKEDPSAIIEDPRKQEQDVFLIGDMIFGEARLKAVFRDRVEIDRSGSIEILKLDEGLSDDKDTSSGTGNEIVVSEKELDDNLANLPMLLTQVRAVPYFKDGQATGLRLFAIKSGSLFEKIGLKNGDILKTINGNSLGDFSQAMKLFETLKQERSLKLVLERNREEQAFSYVIR